MRVGRQARPARARGHWQAVRRANEIDASDIVRVPCHAQVTWPSCLCIRARRGEDELFPCAHPNQPWKGDWYLTLAWHFASR